MQVHTVMCPCTTPMFPGQNHHHVWEHFSSNRYILPIKETFITLEFSSSELPFHPVQSSSCSMNILPILVFLSAVFNFIFVIVDTIGLTDVFKMPCFYVA